MTVNPKETQAASDQKAPLEYLDPVMDEDLAYVMKHGADKYGLRNYRDTPIKVSTYIGAMRRHLRAWSLGEDADPDSGRPHLAHIVACCVVIEAARESGNLVDDRHDRWSQENRGVDKLAEELDAEARVHRASTKLREAEQTGRYGDISDEKAMRHAAKVAAAAGRYMPMTTVHTACGTDNCCGDCPTAARAQATEQPKTLENTV